MSKTGDYKFLRLAERREEALTDVEAIEAAKAAWQAAKEAQIELSSDQHGQQAWLSRWDDQPISEALYEYACIRGDLTELYARQQLAAIIERRVRLAVDERQRLIDFTLQQTAVAPVVAEMPFIRQQRADELRRLARDVPTLTIHGCSVADWLHERADRIEADS